MSADDVQLIKTCDYCPEQYVAVDHSGRQIGYLRMRWGEFYVYCPDMGGRIVYNAYPKGAGWFEDDEREEYLQIAKQEIAEYWNKHE